MTLKLTVFGGTDWADGDILTAADLNNTIGHAGSLAISSFKNVADNANEILYIEADQSIAPNTYNHAIRDVFSTSSGAMATINPGSTTAPFLKGTSSVSTRGNIMFYGYGDKIFDNFNATDSTTIGNGWTEETTDWFISGNVLRSSGAAVTPVIRRYDFGALSNFNVLMLWNRLAQTNNNEFRLNVNADNTYSTGYSMAIGSEDFFIRSANIAVASRQGSLIPSNTWMYARMYFSGTGLAASIWRSGTDTEPTTATIAGSAAIQSNSGLGFAFDLGGGHAATHTVQELLIGGGSGQGAIVTEPVTAKYVPTATALFLGRASSGANTALTYDLDTDNNGTFDVTGLGLNVRNANAHTGSTFRMRINLNSGTAAATAERLVGGYFLALWD